MTEFEPLSKLPLDIEDRYQVLYQLTSDSSRMFFSSWHPVAFILNDRGIRFYLATWNSCPVLLAESSDYYWLPLPPQWVWKENDSRGSFFRDASQWLFKLNKKTPGRIDNLPIGLSSRMPNHKDPVRQDIDRILLRDAHLRAAGNRYRSHRWELNRIRKIDPSPEILPWPQQSFWEMDFIHAERIRDIKSRFFKMRREKARDELEWLLVEDLERAHRIAEENWKKLHLECAILSMNSQPVAWQWLAFSPTWTTAICFLECRDPDIPHAPTMMTHLVFQKFPDLLWINIGGDSGISGLGFAKDQDHPGILVPTFTQDIPP